MGKHTPGPWNRSWVYGALRHINKNVDDDVFLFEPVPEGEETPNVRINPADADLIAAAPDLLAALKGMLDIYGELHAQFDVGDCQQTLDARAAIAKAEGNQ